MKHIILLFTLLMVSLSLFSQDYRDTFIGEYECERSETDISGNTYWYNVSVWVEKSASDLSQLIITDSSIVSAGSPHCAATVDTNGHFFVPDEMYYVGDFYIELDSLRMYRSYGSPWGGGYNYFGKKNTTAINYNYHPEFIRIYPNPVESLLFVKLKSNANTKYNLYNLKGECLEKGNFAFEKQIDISGFPKGIYFLKLINNAYVYSEKIIIQ